MNDFPQPISSDGQTFPSNDVALAWLTMQGKAHPRQFLVGSIMRDGVPELVKKIEQSLYGSPESSGEFHLIALTWEEHPFVVLSIPERDDVRLRTLIEKVPPFFRLSDGEPHICEVEPESGTFTLTAWRHGSPDDEEKARRAGFTAPKCFPLTGRNVFTIEYLRVERGPFISGVFTGGGGELPQFHRASDSPPFRPMDTSGTHRRRRS